MRVLITGARSLAYPEDGVRRAFVLVRQTAKAAGYTGRVTMTNGACRTGVDRLVNRLVLEYGWISDPWEARWKECSPLCKGKPESHRQPKPDGTEYCPFAGPWRNQRMVDDHKVRPYTMCLALPWISWANSRGTKDCYDRAFRAKIFPTIALDHRGEFFVDNRRIGEIHV